MVLGLCAALALASFSRKGRMGLCGDDIRRFRIYASMELRRRKGTSCLCERTASHSSKREREYIDLDPNDTMHTSYLRALMPLQCE